MTNFNYRTDTPDIIDRWPYEFQRIPDDGTAGLTQYNYLSAYATELRRIDVFIDELYEQRFVESATSRELEKLALPVDVTRKVNETDDQLRYRAQLGKAIAASDGTPKDFETILAIAFGEENLGSIDVENVSDQPMIRLRVPSPLIDEIPLSVGDLTEELKQSLPCGHSLEIITGDTFLLGESGDQGLGNGDLL